MVHPELRPPIGERSRFRRRREHPSAPLFRTIALLDSTSMDIKSGVQHAGDVRGVGVGCNRRDLFLMVASGRIPIPGEGSRTVGAFAVPANTCSDGALLQHAVSARLACNLLRSTVGSGATKLEVARRVHWFEHRTSLYALPLRTGCLRRCVRNVSIPKAVQTSCSAGSDACRFVFTLAAYSGFSAAPLELDWHPSLI